ncbi:amino acid/polyamine transporter I [Aspergillus karnatakaensis]|uniref:putative GABA permease n=1 Tax=Aspergillus karnatakaensis TaxID=1810916 RepID=UPI003CCDB2A9
MLAPPRFMKFLSYMTGWLTVIGWQSALASAAFIAGTQIQGVARLAHSHYDLQAWHGTFIMWAATLMALGVNLAGGKLLPRLEIVILVFHILGFFAILIPLTYMAEHKSTHDVFLEFANGGGFPSRGLSWFVGIKGVVFAFAGGDAAVHMAEEVRNASVAIPRATMLSVLINGSLGFGMLIAVLFCLGDLDAALATPTGYPYMEIFYQATDSVSGALGMISIIVIIGLCTPIALLAATSRQFWSFARDRAVPGWRIWSQVSHINQLPTYSILLTTSVTCALGLINIGSSVALNGIISMAVSGVYLSYLTVGVLLLWRRCTGAITLTPPLPTFTPEQPDPDPIVLVNVNVPGAKLVWGPFHVPGIWGIAINAYAVVFMIIVVFFSFWPSTYSGVTEKTMNFSVVGTVGTVILAVLYYVVRARRVYQGPVMEVRVEG